MSDSGSMRSMLQSVVEAKRHVAQAAADAIGRGAGDAEYMAEELGKVESCLDVAMESYAEVGAALNE